MEEQQIAQQPDPQPIQPEVKKSFPKKIVFLILGVVVLGLVVGGGVMVASRQNRVSQVSPTPSVVVSPTMIPDSTANWKTYSNSQYIFSLKYPSTFTLEDKSDQFPPFSIFISDPSRQETYEGGTTINPYIVIQAIPTSLSLDQYIQAPSSNVTFKEKKVFGDQQYSVVSESFGMGESPDYYLIKNGNTIFRISNNFNVDPSLFDQILSSFKFTDQNGGIRWEAGDTDLPPQDQKNLIDALAAYPSNDPKKNLVVTSVDTSGMQSNIIFLNMQIWDEHNEVIPMGGYEYIAVKKDSHQWEVIPVGSNKFCTELKAAPLDVRESRMIYYRCSE